MIGWIKSLFSSETVLLRVTIPNQGGNASAAEISRRDDIIKAINQMNYLEFVRKGEQSGSVFFEYRGKGAKAAREFLGDVLSEEGLNGTVTVVDESTASS